MDPAASARPAEAGTSAAAASIAPKAIALAAERIHGPLVMQSGVPREGDLSNDGMTSPEGTADDDAAG